MSISRGVTAGHCRCPEGSRPGRTQIEHDESAYPRRADVERTSADVAFGPRTDNEHLPFDDRPHLACGPMLFVCRHDERCLARLRAWPFMALMKATGRRTRPGANVACILAQVIVTVSGCVVAVPLVNDAFSQSEHPRSRTGRSHSMS